MRTIGRPKNICTLSSHRATRKLYEKNGLFYRVPIGPKVSFKVQRNFILVRLKVNLR